MIGSGTLYDGLYKLNLDNLYVETLMTLHHNVGTKRSLVDERFAYLWHKRLGHISKERMQRLVKNEILPDLNFTYLNVCVCVWIVLKANKINTQRKEPREALGFLKSYI